MIFRRIFFIHQSLNINPNLHVFRKKYDVTQKIAEYFKNKFSVHSFQKAIIVFLCSTSDKTAAPHGVS